MRAAFYTLGCKVNQYETSAMMRRFSAEGFDIADSSEDADVYIVNSCTVTATGDKKSRQVLRRFRRQNPSAVICLCGCFPQAFPEDVINIPEADIITGSGNRMSLVSSVKKFLIDRQRIVDIIPHQKGEKFENMSVSGQDSRTRAFLKIQDGCERYCAYCIIPKARGPLRSKPLAELKAELENLADKQYREVVLVGINLSSYGQDMGLRLIDAVRLACGMRGIERVRLGSLEPELLSDDDIKEMSGFKSLCPQFHLSLQSGSDGILKAMRRHYDKAEYARIVSSLRNVFPGCAITTDIMTGFPGETEQHHEESLVFAKEIGFAKAHVFAYSARPGTVAARLDGQIPEDVKHRRSLEMSQCTAITRKGFLAGQIGSVVPVLFEQMNDGFWQGYSENYTPVMVQSDAGLQGQILDVSITDSDDESCYGWISSVII